MMMSQNIKQVTASMAWMACGALLLALSTWFIGPQEWQDEELTYAGMVTLLGAFLCLGVWASKKTPYALYGHEQIVHMRCSLYVNHHFYGGSPKQFEAYMRTMDYVGFERIELVAVKLRNGNLYAVEPPGRHHHVKHMLSQHGVSHHHSSMGFITNTGRYVSRNEGLIIATSAAQLIRKTEPANQLFSEDLWNTPLSHRGMSFDEKQLTGNGDWKRHHVQLTQPPMEQLRLEDAKAPPAMEEYERKHHLLWNIKLPEVPNFKLPEGILRLTEVQDLAKRAKYYMLEVKRKYEAAGYKHPTPEPARPSEFANHLQAVNFLEELATYMLDLRKGFAEYSFANRPEVLNAQSSRIKHLADRVMGRDKTVNIDVVKSLAYVVIQCAEDEGVVLMIDYVENTKGAAQMTPVVRSLESMEVTVP